MSSSDLKIPKIPQKPFVFYPAVHAPSFEVLSQDLKVGKDLCVLMNLQNMKAMYYVY